MTNQDMHWRFYILATVVVFESLAMMQVTLAQNSKAGDAPLVIDDPRHQQVGPPNTKQPPPISGKEKMMKDLSGSGKSQMAPTQAGKTNSKQPSPIK